MIEFIEWSTTIGVRGWLLVVLSLGLSVLIGLLTYRYFQSLTHKTIRAQLTGYKQTQKSAATINLPIALGGIVFGLLLIAFGIVEIGGGLFIVILVTLSYLIMPLNKRFRPCTVVLSRGTYYVSDSWIGKNLIDTENNYRIEEKYYYNVRLQVIYVKDKMVGFLVHKASKVFPE